jgi:hypothetical protein
MTNHAENTPAIERVAGAGRLASEEPDSPRKPVGSGDSINTREAKGFLEFNYPEIKDLGKHFLTAVAAVLAVSVAFAEKIVNFDRAPFLPRALLIASWALGLMAFLLGGTALHFNYKAGDDAKWETLFPGATTHRRRSKRWALRLLFFAGVAFSLALAILVLIGMLRLFNHPVPITP